MGDFKDIWKGADEHTTIHELLEKTRCCEGTAMDICGETMSYERFHALSDAAAACLQSEGLGKEDIVIVSMRACCELFCMIAGVIKAGAVVTVTEDTIPETRLKAIRGTTHAKKHITQKDAAAIFEKGRALPYRPVFTERTAGDVYAIWFTSGSTGEPCGIRTVSYNTILNIIGVKGNEAMFDMLSNCTALLSISHPGFALGFTNFFYTILYGKKYVHIQTGLNHTMSDTAAKLRENDSCAMLYTPSAVEACLADEETRAALKHCRSIMIGSDMVKPSLVCDLRSALKEDAKILILYGVSEVGLVAVRVVEHPEKMFSVGHLTAFTEMTVVDEQRRPLRAGEKGEIAFCGIRVGPSYLNASANKMNKYVFGEDGSRTFYTGDYGYITEDGEVFMLGRVDRIIKHLGFRVDPMEIEEAMKKELHVRQAAVKQVEYHGRPVLAAFYVNPERLDPEKIRNRIASVLPRYALPERFIRLDALPLTERGKLDYRALTIPETDGEPAAYEAPATQTEEKLGRAFSEVLKIPKVGRRDSFFELGGDSVIAMLLLSKLMKEYGIRLTVADIFHAPTVEGLALLLAQAERAGDPAGGPAGDGEDGEDGTKQRKTVKKQAEQEESAQRETPQEESAQEGAPQGGGAQRETPQEESAQEGAPQEGAPQGGGAAAALEHLTPEELQLPPQLMPLLEDEETEAIYPAEGASALYLFLRENKSRFSRNGRMLFCISCRRSYTEEGIRVRVRALQAAHPVLRSYFYKDQSGKRWQVFRKEQEAPVYYKDISALSAAARERFVSGFRGVMEEADAPFQLACFPDGGGGTILLLYAWHALLDGMSASILINELAAEEMPAQTDAFYALRSRRLRESGREVEALTDYYRNFGERMRLPVSPLTDKTAMKAREIALDRDETRALEAYCRGKNISLITYAEYSFGKGLLSALGREDVWFSCTYSGRDGDLPGSEGIVGNLFYQMPVQIRSDMTPADFQEGLLIPWQYPYITESALYKRLNMHQVEEGVISHMFIPYGEDVISVTDTPDPMNNSHSMEMRDGCLVLTLRHPEGEAEERSFDRIEQVMRRLMTAPGSAADT